MCSICLLLQAAQSKKGKAAEKSPAEETAKTVAAAAEDADVKLVKEQIEAQGQKVRELKASGAAKVIIINNSNSINNKSTRRA